MRVEGQCPRILLVEDDAGLATMVADVLQARGYSVWRAESGCQATRVADEIRPDVIVLDLMLADGNGLTVCSELKHHVGCAVIICSATRRRDDAVIGFQLGADDFLRKPFTVDELNARIDLALQRQLRLPSTAQSSHARVQRVGSLTVDHSRCEATTDGQVVPLTPTEFRLLSAVTARAGEVVSRQELAEGIWTATDEGVIRSLEVHMRRLRSKLASAAPSTRLVTRRGFGYELVQDGAS
jgi:DNA-binding response OmpR family regulator